MSSVSSLSRFSDPEGICSAAKATAAGVVLPPSAFTHTVVSKGGKLSVSSMRLMYGHEVADATANLHSDEHILKFAYAPLSISRALSVDIGGEKIKRWNPSDPSLLSTGDRLSYLRSDPDHGFILAVVKHWDSRTSSFGAPILRVVAAPSLLTTSVITDPAIDPEAIWSTLPPFIAASQAEVAPIIAAGAGFSREISVLPSVSALFKETDPVVLLSADEVAGSTTVAGSAFWRTWFLPVGCCAPVGITWDLHDATIPDLVATVKGVNSKSGERFGATLTTITSDLTTWLAAAQDDPDAFAVEAVPWASFAPYFPDLLTGSVPTAVDDEELLAPILDAVTRYTWRLVVDRLITSTVARPLSAFYAYLAHMASAIPEMACFGGKLDPRVFPQVPYLFPIHGGWPFGADWITLLQAQHLVSVTAALWVPSVIDLQTAGFTASLLSTLADKDAQDHLARTPTLALGSSWRPVSLPTGESPVPAAAFPPRDMVRQYYEEGTTDEATAQMTYHLEKLQERHEAEIAVLRQQIAGATLPAGNRLSPHQPRLSMPTARRPASPVAYQAVDTFTQVPQFSPADDARPSTVHRGTVSWPASRSLFDSTSHAGSAKWSEAGTWTLSSIADRQRCAPVFISLSQLLVHASHTDSPPHLFIRAPCAAFRQDVLIPTFQGSTPGSFIDSAHQHLQMCMYPNAFAFKDTYATSFFEASSLKLVLQPTSWEMAEHFNPMLSDSSSWTVYSFLGCLRSQASHRDGLLPAQGLTLVEAKHMGMFIVEFFRALDRKSDRTNTAPFDSSLLGEALHPWVAMLDNVSVLSLWQASSKALTFWWLHDLREILLPFQQLVMANRWAHDHGFLPSDMALIVSPHCGGPDGPHLVTALEAARSAFRSRWNPSRLMTLAPFLQNIPEHHFRRGFVPLRLPLVGGALAPPVPDRGSFTPAPPAGQARSRKRDRDQEATPHFRSGIPLFQLIQPTIPTTPSGVAGLFLNAPTVQAGERRPRLFRLNDPVTGKSLNVCLKSSCQAPWNCCRSLPCAQRPRPGQAVPREEVPFLHVDLAVSPWRDAPEATWAPIVQYLKLPGVRQVIAPSEAFKGKTPSTDWS